MAIQFEAKNELLVLKSQDNLTEKIEFLKNLYDKTLDKVNHFDRLRQQLLNYAILVFSGLLAFSIKTELKAENALMQFVACAGVAILMVIFRYSDQRYHRTTHGYDSSMIIFNRAIVYLLDHPNDDVQFFQYHTAGESKAQEMSLQTFIYSILAISSVILGLTILVMAQWKVAVCIFYAIVLAMVVIGLIVVFEILSKNWNKTAIWN